MHRKIKPRDIREDPVELLLRIEKWEQDNKDGDHDCYAIPVWWMKWAAVQLRKAGVVQR